MYKYIKKKYIYIDYIYIYIYIYIFNVHYHGNQVFYIQIILQQISSRALNINSKFSNIQ